MHGIIPPEYLICPNCDGKLTFSNVNLSYECSACKTIFPIEKGVIRLLPKNLEITKLNEDEVWRTHEMEGVEKPPWLALIHKSNVVRFLLDKILPEFEIRGRLLEIGAGSCWASGLIKLKYPAAEVIASDVSPTALYKGIEVVELLNSSVDYYVACDAERLPFASELFDFVFGSAIIHHFLNPEKGVSEIFRVLKNNGMYIGIGEFGCNKIMGYIRKFGFFGSRERQLGIKENIFTMGEWRKLFSSCGFRYAKLNLERDWRYKQYHWFISLYYKVLSAIPSYLVRLFLASSIGITAGKQGARIVAKACAKSPWPTKLETLYKDGNSIFCGLVVSTYHIIKRIWEIWNF